MRVQNLFFLVLLLLALVVPGPGLAVDATSFDPIPVTITSQSTIAVGTVIAWPVGSNPWDMGKWLECNGQAVPSGTQYDRLRALVGSNVPNYNDQFLRGTTAVVSVGTKVADTIRSHSVYVPGQNAPVSGSASPQTSWFNGAWGSGGQMVSGLDSGIQVNDGWNYYTGTSQTSGGSINGVAYVSDQTGSYSGGSETAPVHTKVRYLIRSIL